MENQNDKSIDKLENLNFWILVSLAFGCLYGVIYYEVAPTFLRILVEYCPQLEQKIENENSFALWVVSNLIFGLIYLLAAICEAIQHALAQKPIPNDNILDAPDEL
jgi:hypothetical protein